MGLASEQGIVLDNCLLVCAVVHVGRKKIRRTADDYGILTFWVKRNLALNKQD